MSLRRVSLIIFFVLLTIIGLFFRLYHIEFGLPHSFHADEPEIAELAIKYTFELRDIIASTEYYRLKPISFVYGSFPAYFFTIATILYSKTLNLFNNSFSKTDIYIYLRSLNAIISILMIFSSIGLYKTLFSHKEKIAIGSVVLTFLVALNWKLIVHAHYLNVDIIIALLLSFSYLCFLKYLGSQMDTKYTILTALFYGLAVGTKITVLITLPLYLIFFLNKKNLLNLAAFLIIVTGIFVITNPFTLIYSQEFVFRIYTLSFKENGMVFDSVDYGLFKYIFALGSLSTPLILAASLAGMYYSLDEKRDRDKHLFLLFHIVLYLVFFSLGTRRVDRWLLPILPIVFIYASYFINESWFSMKKVYFILLLFILSLGYMFFPLLLLRQYKEHTPKSAAYIWMRDEVSPAAKKLVITEEGLDPMNKLLSVYVLNYEVYGSENAQFRTPEHPIDYDYVVLSSRPMQNFKRPEVYNTYPFYYEKWNSFENLVLDDTLFVLEKSFELPKPNLIEASDVYIYKYIGPPVDSL